MFIIRDFWNESSWMSMEAIKSGRMMSRSKLETSDGRWRPYLKDVKLKKIADSTKHTFNSSKRPSIITSTKRVWMRYDEEIRYIDILIREISSSKMILLLSCRFFIELFSEVKKFYVEILVSSNFNITYLYNSCDSLMDCKAF